MAFGLQSFAIFGGIKVTSQGLNPYPPCQKGTPAKGVALRAKIHRAIPGARINTQPMKVSTNNWPTTERGGGIINVVIFELQKLAEL